jgi:hypothetical protein
VEEKTNKGEFMENMVKGLQGGFEACGHQLSGMHNRYRKAFQLLQGL